MKIRFRLSLQFSIIVASILVLFSVGIYYFSSAYREKEFLNRLEMKAISNARMLIDVKEIDGAMLKLIDQNTQSSLYSLQVLILNPKNQPVYSNFDGNDTSVFDQFLNDLSSSENIKLRLDNAEGIGVKYYSGNQTYKIFVSAYDKTGMKQLAHLRIILLSGLIICIFIIWFSGYFFAGKALYPISKVVSQVEKITASNLNLRVNTSNPHDEIAQLAATFNSMLERLEAAFKMQRNFVSNASHELRTPLTSITGQIEVALISQRQPTEYENILRSLLEDIKGLNALSNGLLELAQSNLDLTSFKLIPLRVDETLLEIQTDMTRQHPEYQINIDYDEKLEDESNLTIVGNNNLLKVAFRNLIDNGCKFSDDKRVDVKISSTKGEISISIKDLGIGIPKNELDKVFEPFYRAKNSRSKVGHGIGLSLALKIIELHKGTLSIDSMENTGTLITVNLPENIIPLS
ncbi:MAG TPA: ATP-binding protein [Bacteroidales bacterium]|nr:ATP-binding protein [Bacteroidales bacterium]